MTIRSFPPNPDRPVASFLACALVLASTLGLPAPAVSAEPPSPKVKAALDLLERNPSPKAFRDAVRRAGLTKAEAQVLENAMKTPRYDAAYRSLRTKAEAETFGPAGTQQDPRSLDLQALRQTIRQEHTTRLARLQAQAQVGLQQPTGRMGSVARRPNPALTSRMAAFAGARAPSNPSPVRLTGIDPSPAITGVRLGIIGRDLGRQGEVTIIVGAEDPRPENAFDCPIIGWGSEVIHVMVPVEIEDMHRLRAFPNGQRSALVWVRPQGDPSGRWMEINVTLNPRHFVPVIEAAATELTPGLRFGIRGQNLTAGSEPVVKITQALTNRWQRLRNLSSFSYWLEVEVPDDVGQLREGPVGLTVSNGLAESRPYVSHFTPVEEVVELTSDSLDACSYSILSMFFGSIPGDCILSGIWGVESRLLPFERIKVGDQTVTRLANDWRVVGVTTQHTYRDGNGSGCYLEHAPAAGATEFATTELVGWANGFCGIVCQAELVIRGPRGVPVSR
ncbi:MAG: hypothetical protein HY825_04715 [Acidobacteria bacterium]|nr:hypothetical protein [Acidobacteriota bacterium]